MCVWTLSLTARCGGPTSINPHLILAVLTTSATARSPASPTARRVGGRRSRDGCRAGLGRGETGSGSDQTDRRPRAAGRDGWIRRGERPSVRPSVRPAGRRQWRHFTSLTKCPVRRPSQPPPRPPALGRGGFRHVQRVRLNTGPHKRTIFSFFCNMVTSHKY